MSRKKSYLTATDIFCGAGGSSQGAREAGVEVRLAMNHWPLAVKTHATNFKDTDHDCADISAADPRRYDSTDILIASPECTNHSLAKGKGRVKKQLNIFEEQKAAEERSRATMWDVPRFAEVHQYNIIITENVIDAKRWVQYPAWLHAMQLLGYDYTECFFNSMHFHPTPQSRDRLFVIFHKKGNKAPDLNHKPEAYCPKCEKNVFAIQTWKPGCLPWGKYRTQYIFQCPCGEVVEPYYYAAMNCIDFSIKSERIGDKKKKLTQNTLDRVQIGIDKYWNNPFIMYGGDRGPKGKLDRTYGIDRALPTQCGQPWHSLISPFIVRNTNPGHWKDIGSPIGTQIATAQHSLISPFFTYSSNNHGNPDKVSDGKNSIKTQTATQDAGMVMPPFLIEQFGASTTRSVDKPINTQCGSIHNGLVSSEAWQAFIGYYYGNACDSHITDPLGTCTTKDRHYMVNFEAGKKIAVEDCYYRMIRAKEVGAAMAFESDYVVLGDERQKVKQYGNAVTPPVMKWIINQCAESLK